MDPRPDELPQRASHVGGGRPLTPNCQAQLTIRHTAGPAPPHTKCPPLRSSCGRGRSPGRVGTRAHYPDTPQGLPCSLCGACPAPHREPEQGLPRSTHQSSCPAPHSTGPTRPNTVPLQGRAYAARPARSHPPPLGHTTTPLGLLLRRTASPSGRRCDSRITDKLDSSDPCG